MLPTLPDSLVHLNCLNNLLTFIPKFPDSLTYIDYSRNPVHTYIKDKCGGNIKIYHGVNEQFANKLVRWYLDCRENPIYKFCRARLDKEYDALMEEDINGIIGGIMC